MLTNTLCCQVGDTLEVLPGSEFRVAFEEAMKHSCKVILGDRPVQVRLKLCVLGPEQIFINFFSQNKHF